MKKAQSELRKERGMKEGRKKEIKDYKGKIIFFLENYFK